MEAQLFSGRPTLPGLPSRRIDLIVVHCSATASGVPLQRGVRGELGFMDCVQIINAWHAARGFKRALPGRVAFNPALPSIGYHYVIDLDGTILAGRHPDEVPAQAAGFNAHALGICLVGGAERVGRFTPAQWASLGRLVPWLLSTYALPAAAPTRVDDESAEMGYRVVGGVCGHRDLSPDTNKNHRVDPQEWVKTCPGFDVSAWLANRMRPLPEHVFEAAS
jgi:N-acetylmuramoyl-L-alanine amidase